MLSLLIDISTASLIQFQVVGGGRVVFGCVDFVSLFFILMIYKNLNKYRIKFQLVS